MRESKGNIPEFMKNSDENPPPDWKLPAGVAGGLWDYLHDPDLARGYDAYLGKSPLVELDQAFVKKRGRLAWRLFGLGCGTGRLLIEAVREGQWALGIDISEEMLRIAEEKARNAGLSIHRMKANLVEPDGLADQSFDH